MAISAGTDISECEMSIQTTRLEKEYEIVRASSTRLIDTEKDRVRRMENLLLQFERDTLKAQLDQANEQLLQVTQTEREARTQLEEAFGEIDRLDAHVQYTSNENIKLKDELSALNDTSSSHSNLLTEKLRLSRDLSNLQTELDRLRNQDSSYQTLISEKHGLERQLNSLEVQLENEKISHERTRTKGSQQTAEFDRLSKQIEGLEGELARELRAKQQIEHENRQQNTEWDRERSVFEGRIETLRKQLRNAKDKLQEAQHELQHRRGNVRIESETTESRSRAVPLQRPGPVPDYQSGMTISTPGAVRVQDKIKRQSALPGDKSAFSITPYLNRTGKSRDSPESSDAEDEPARKLPHDKTATSRKADTAGELSGEDASPDNRDTSKRAPPSKIVKGKSKARESKPASQPAPRISLEEDGAEPSLGQAQSKIKRRKLGAQRERSLFEDEEEEDMVPELRKPGRKLGLGNARSSVLATTTTQAGAGDRLSRNLGFGASAGFSPLKKDRKRL